jgi:hypothetical protein
LEFHWFFLALSKSGTWEDHAYDWIMLRVRTLRRSTEFVNLSAIVAFGILGVLILALGIVKSSPVIIIMGVLYAGGTAWYLGHLLLRVASELQLDPVDNEISWRALWHDAHFPLSSVTEVRQSFQPDVYVFVLDNGSKVRFWHRNRSNDAQAFFQELRRRLPEVDLDVLYNASGARWRRGLSRDDTSVISR